jgi:hypothetical protein
LLALTDLCLDELLEPYVLLAASHQSFSYVRRRSWDRI